jgi:hypothetical protein
VNGVIFAAFVFFSLEIFLLNIAEKSYRVSFYFILDVLGTLSLITEIPWLLALVVSYAYEFTGKVTLSSLLGRRPCRMGYHYWPWCEAPKLLEQAVGWQELCVWWGNSNFVRYCATLRAEPFPAPDAFNTIGALGRLYPSLSYTHLHARFKGIPHRTSAHRADRQTCNHHRFNHSLRHARVSGTPT